MLESIRLPGGAGIRRQAAELPAFTAVVTELQGHARACPPRRRTTGESIA